MGEEKSSFYCFTPIKVILIGPWHHFPRNVQVYLCPLLPKNTHFLEQLEWFVSLSLIASEQFSSFRISSNLSVFDLLKKKNPNGECWRRRNRHGIIKFFLLPSIWSAFESVQLFFFLRTPSYCGNGSNILSNALMY